MALLLKDFMIVLVVHTICYVVWSLNFYEIVDLKFHSADSDFVK